MPITYFGTAFEWGATDLAANTIDATIDRTNANLRLAPASTLSEDYLSGRQSARITVRIYTETTYPGLFENGQKSTFVLKRGDIAREYTGTAIVESWNESFVDDQNAVVITANLVVCGDLTEGAIA